MISKGSGGVIAHKDDETYVRQIYDAINNSMDKVKYFIRLEIVEIEEKKLLHININPSDEPVNIIHKNYNKIKQSSIDHDLFYCREGDSAIPLRGFDLVNYYIFKIMLN